MHCLTCEEQQQNAIAELRCQHKRIKVLSWRLWCGRGQRPRQQALHSIHFLLLKILLTLQIPFLNANLQFSALCFIVAWWSWKSKCKIRLLFYKCTLSPNGEIQQQQRLRLQKIKYLADVFYLVLAINSPDTNKIWSKQRPFFSPLYFPNLECHKMRRKALWHPLLW